MHLEGHCHVAGIYLPLLWEPSFCSKSPLCLGYTRGHFSALSTAWSTESLRSSAANLAQMR
ncbi:Uncharacterized protein OBRU01_22868 [Operophtera brumata]|uniref:Uncharacterized protein n=1 Tax=Operophtera brumata TaxID=104452 RepID=A0A0L7KQE6_OPEBR|nr:Uncharacterized protein OBRU01_22868 [Operophtera brumata]